MQETSKLQELQDEAFQSKNFTALKEYFKTEEYKALPYLVRNRGFITSHKMQMFMKCQFCYAQKYINEIEDPTEGDNEAFIIGQAIDDMLTDGVEAFSNRYEVVARRSKESTKKQLTLSQGALVSNMKKEFQEQKMFKQNLNKTIVFAQLGGFTLKAELDDIDLDNRSMKDLKSTANITTFNPQNYVHQMSVYQLIVEEETGIRCSADLEVVDKNGDFSRSGLFHFTEQTLFGNRGALLQTLSDMKSAHESGIFTSARDQAILYDCPYYGLKTNASPEGHGRPTKPVIF